MNQVPRLSLRAGLSDIISWGNLLVPGLVADEVRLAAALEGPDFWTLVNLETDFTTSSASNTNVTGMAFVPRKNTRYLIYGYFLLRTADPAVGPRPGIAWPSGGITDAIAKIEVPDSATAQVLRYFGPQTTANAASTGLPDASASWFSKLEAVLLAGAAPVGNFQVTLASETGGTNVTMKAGSFLHFREIR